MIIFIIALILVTLFLAIAKPPTIANSPALSPLTSIFLIIFFECAAIFVQDSETAPKKS